MRLLFDMILLMYPAHPGGVRAPNANDYIEIFNLYK